MDDMKHTIDWAIHYIEKVSDMTRTAEKQDLLAALKALDAPATPPEDARDRAIAYCLIKMIDAHPATKPTPERIDAVAKELSAYADSIRKQCANEMGGEVWEKLCPAGWDKENWIREVSAIMRKE